MFITHEWFMFLRSSSSKFNSQDIFIKSEPILFLCKLCIYGLTDRHHHLMIHHWDWWLMWINNAWISLLADLFPQSMSCNVIEQRYRFLLAFLTTTAHLTKEDQNLDQYLRPRPNCRYSTSKAWKIEINKSC